ncbi:MAG TPA: transcriptional repressor [Anaeromyxobacteraceae bacterium]
MRIRIRIDPDQAEAAAMRHQEATQGDRRGAGPARSAVAQLGTFIAERGLKQSRQRTLIVETFYAMGGHVPVERLVAEVRRQEPRVSVATVYRTMKLLAECGLAVPRQFGETQTLYEPAGGRGHHDHLICTACGRIVEFENQRIEALQRRVARTHGFEVESHKLELYGRCAGCRSGPGRAVPEPSP